MIEILSHTTDTCLLAQFSGKVTGQEYQKSVDAVNERLKARKDMQFGFGEYMHIQRAAFVGDQKWLKWVADLIGPFTRAEEKDFPRINWERLVVGPVHESWVGD